MAEMLKISEESLNALLDRRDAIIDALTAERDALKERVARLSAPVSDIENDDWEGYAEVYGFLDAADNLIKDRAKGEQP